MRVMTTRLLAALLAVVLGLTLTACTLTVEAPPSTEETAAGATGSAPQERTDPDSGLDWVDLADLPPEAAETMELIEADGPFPYDRDGITFQNREGLLPDQPRGYYREYTVPTPGERDRGARRIVAGEQGEYYWTADHYESFCEFSG